MIIFFSTPTLTAPTSWVSFEFSDHKYVTSGMYKKLTCQISATFIGLLTFLGIDEIITFLVERNKKKIVAPTF